ncbi:hypothetical protein AB0M64_36390, partial [Streptomyces sp. NPDC051771]
VELSRNWPQTTHTYANGALARTEEGRRLAAGRPGPAGRPSRRGTARPVPLDRNGRHGSSW